MYIYIYIFIFIYIYLKFACDIHNYVLQLYIIDILYTYRIHMRHHGIYLAVKYYMYMDVQSRNLIFFILDRLIYFHRQVASIFYYET